MLLAKDSDKHSAAWRCKLNCVEASSTIAAFNTVLHWEDFERQGEIHCATEEEGFCMQEHGAALLKRQVNLMEGAVAALDGEGDPRCLLLGFQAIRELSCLYTQHDPEVPPAFLSIFWPFEVTIQRGLVAQTAAYCELARKNA